MWIIYIVLYILSLAIPFSGTKNIDWDAETPFPTMSGCAAYYSKNTMEYTAQALGYIERKNEYGEWLHENGYIGAVAVYRTGDVGKDVHILWPDGTLEGPYIAIDVVALHHYNLGLSRNRVIDVDYKTAVAHDMKGPMSVTIVYGNTDILNMAYGSDNKFETGITTEKYKWCIGSK